ncbi:MAG: helix-turn-helix transcriptional regulator [Mesorhizobium sp.]|uniref:AraC family transcriptional regulator n=1 Tax=Mesorhizobium sp. TaxID=1871066 RepID=UPI001AC41BCD|nr:AraC family transcriptional regulator [Mesorhizobium sp.]MBN9221255.1 helix-turn-helix transcriptional regulator [Mesorhizobium sp.]
MLTDTAVQKWISYADYFKASAYSSFPQEHRYSPGRLECRMIVADMSMHGNTDPYVPDLVVSMPLIVTKEGAWSWNLGDGWHRDTLAPGRIVAMPPYTTSRWMVEGDRRNLVLLIPTSTINRILGASAPPDLCEAFAPLSLEAWDDPLLHAMMVRLWEASERSQLTDYLLADGLLIAILSQLLQRAGTLAKRPDQIALSPHRMRRLMEFVGENLHKKIGLLEMAEVAKLSVRHFARAFRQETGDTPHRWLMARRVDRAKAMLIDTDEDCQAIADMCGFASQSHLTIVLKSATGKTPKKWREFHKSP